MAKSWASRSPGAGEGEDALPLKAGDLRQDMGGGAETVDAEPLGGAGHAVGAMADQAGAKQGRRLGVLIAAGQPEAVAVVGERVFLDSRRRHGSR